MHRARVTVPCRDELGASAVAMAIEVEADDVPPGASMTCRADGADAILEAQAQDLGALRACLHSMVRLADAARQVAGLAG